MKVSVVIPNYNGEKFLRECLQSLREQSQPHEVIVVDNASKDGSCALMAREFPEVRVLVQEENLGFAGGVNAGIRAAKGEYVALLNNDTRADEHFLRALVRLMDAHPNAFSASSKMIQYNDPSRIDDAGDTLTLMGVPAQMGHGAKATRYKRDRRILSACGGACIFRKSILDEIGLFDERFFAYCEDVDIGLRALVYGYRNWYCAGSIVYHYGSATSDAISKGTSAFRVRLSARNCLLMLHKNLPPFWLKLHKPLLALGARRQRKGYRAWGQEKAYEEGIAEAMELMGSFEHSYQKGRYHNYWYIEGLMAVTTIPYLGMALRRRMGTLVSRLAPGAWKKWEEKK